MIGKNHFMAVRYLILFNTNIKIINKTLEILR